MRISYLLLTSFFAVLLLFSVTTFINNRQLDDVIVNSESFAKSTIVVRHGNRFQRNFLTMVSGLRGYLLTHEESFIQSYDSALAENDKILSELVVLVRPGSDQGVLLDDIRQLYRYWIDEFAQPLLNAKDLSLRSDSSKAAFTGLYSSKLSSGIEKKAQATLQKMFTDFGNYEYGRRDLQKDELATAVGQTRKISFILTIISVVAGIVISVGIAYYISVRVIRMLRMANEISEGNYSVRLEDKGSTELSKLAHALNNMASILHSNFTLLERQKTELDQFAHIVSHDLKAPLRGIDNVMSWIEEDHDYDLPQKLREYHQLIKTRVNRAEGLLKGILTYAQVGRESRNLEFVDTNELLREVCDSIPDQDGVTIRVMPNLPLLYTERLPLYQVFVNLVSNAVKYHNKEKGNVRIFCRAEKDHFRFFVHDDGPGIDPLYHDKIFVIFQTLQRRDDFESTGIGLSIVKKILDDRGMSIQVESQQGKGSTFSFTWPKHEFYEPNYQNTIGR
jgi:signal transduction histidine kinase